MKKLLLLTLILAIVSVTLVKTADVDAEDAKYEFYIPTNYYIETDDVMKVERLGTFDIVTCEKKDMEKVKAKIGKTLGYTVKFSGDRSAVDSLLSEYGVVIREIQKIDGVEIIYGYSNRLSGGVELNGKKVNVQINYKSNAIAMGTPLIMGSY